MKIIKIKIKFVKAITLVQFTVVLTIVKSRLVVDQTTVYNQEFILKPRLCENKTRSSNQNWNFDQKDQFIMTIVLDSVKFKRKITLIKF